MSHTVRYITGECYALVFSLVGSEPATLSPYGHGFAYLSDVASKSRPIHYLMATVHYI